VRLGPLRDVTINYRHSRFFRWGPRCTALHCTALRGALLLLARCT
jgi:hypothetical protein